MRSIFIDAIKHANIVRDKLGLNMFEPINIYDTCESLDISIRFINVNMEGIYVKSDKHNKPTILLSNERPLPRRVFTCAHEYGHHYYQHGSKIDTLSHTNQYTKEQDEEELLVNAFAGSLLMPVAGIQAEFVKRNINPYIANPIDFYIVSSYYGVGYQTLIYHCKVNRIIDFNKMKELLKYTPAKIFKEHISGSASISHFKCYDNHSQPLVSDFEISNYLVAPNNSTVEANYLESIGLCSLGTVYATKKRGITTIKSPNFKNDLTVRIQDKNYEGLSIYRHL
jgi:Zn-dependent peptidase ImmA (M78 family)